MSNKLRCNFMRRTAKENATEIAENQKPCETSGGGRRRCPKQSKGSEGETRQSVGQDTHP